MELPFKVTFNIPFSMSMRQVSDFLSTGTADRCGFDFIDYDENEYKKAHDYLTAHDKDNKPCLEDVWACMLFMGYKLRFLETETCEGWLDDEGNKITGMHWSWQEKKPIGGEWHDLTLDILTAGFKKYIEKRGGTPNSIIEDGDFYDNEAVLQYAMLGDIIYG